MSYFERFSGLPKHDKKQPRTPVQRTPSPPMTCHKSLFRIDNFQSAKLQPTSQPTTARRIGAVLSEQARPVRSVAGPKPHRICQRGRMRPSRKYLRPSPSPTDGPWIRCGCDAAPARRHHQRAVAGVGGGGVFGRSFFGLTDVSSAIVSTVPFHAGSQTAGGRGWGFASPGFAPP